MREVFANPSPIVGLQLWLYILILLADVVVY